MNPAQPLYELQTLDLRIAADSTALENERGKFQEPRSLREARARALAAENALTAARKELRAAELEVESVAAKKNAVHDKLYGGRVTVPRELAALEAEEESLGHAQERLEDQQLERMAQVEAAEQAQARALAAAGEEMDRWKREGGAAQAHLPQLEASLIALKAEREQLASGIAKPLLDLYERLKPRKGNRPVALVEKNACQGCGVSLPLSEVQRARNADPPQLCDNCGRILYVR